MKTRDELVRACLEMGEVYEDKPFHDDNWSAMRHKGNRKTFAFIFEREEKLWINVKARPAAAEFWRRVFPSVIPAYHMNKTHWISIILDGSMEDKDILSLLSDSFSLTAPKQKTEK